METLKRKYKKKDGYTVSVVYFLKRERDLLDGILKPLYKFPLYIRITFLGQNLKIRSRIHVSLLEEEFDEFINSPEIKELLEIETNSLKYSIRELFPEKVDNFLISSWASYYRKYDETIRSAIDESCLHHLRDGLRLEYSLPEDEVTDNILFTSTTIRGSLNYYAFLNSKTAIALLETAQPILSIPFQRNVIFKKQSISFDYTLWDWRSKSIFSLVPELQDKTISKLLFSYISDYEYNIENI